METPELHMNDKFNLQAFTKDTSETASLVNSVEIYAG